MESPTSTALVVTDSREIERRFMPVMSVDTAVQRYNAIGEAVTKLMERGEDYGEIPGTKKPTLLKPGAEKLCNLFGLIPRYDQAGTVEDWDGADHGGEPFFYYRVKCSLWRGDVLMGEGEGSCNSWESKYRYRKAERACPACGSAAIIKGKAEFGGGWLCFQKKGGCGAKFKEGDPAIEAQIVGRVPNPDIHDQVNTVLKMANKRAQVAATLNATGASRFFTQDLEDGQQASASSYDPHGEETPAPPPKPTPPPVVRPQPDVPDDIQRLWAGMVSIKTNVETMQGLYKGMAELIGSESADRKYKEILGKYQRRDSDKPVEHSNQFATFRDARSAARELFDAIKAMSEPLHVSEADIVEDEPEAQS